MAERNNAAGQNSARVRAAKARRRMLLNVGVAALVIGLGVTFWLTRRAQPRDPEGLVTATVSRRDLFQTVSATGSVTAQTGAMVKIGSQITGRIKRLYADVGGKVKAGQIIAKLDLPDLEAQVQQAEANLAASRARLEQQRSGVAMQDTQTSSDIKKAEASLAAARASLRQVEQSAQLQLATAQAGVRQAQANAKNADTNLQRMKNLLAKGYVAQAEVDNAQAQAEVTAAQLTTAQQNVPLVQAKVDADLEAAREQVRQAEATLAAARAGAAQSTIKRGQVAEAANAVRQSQAALALVRAQLAKSEIRTPISGTVLQLAQQEGETIAAGLSAPTVIIVADLDRLQVDAFVDETDIGQVAVGQRARVTVDAYPNRTFAGRVSKIASGATMQQNVVTYDVTIALENPSHLLKPDMTASVDIEVGRRYNALAVPVDAVKLTTAGSTCTVMSKGPKGQPRFEVRHVRTGISDGEYTEVLRGLKAGDRVVLAGQVPGMSTEREDAHIRGPFGRMGGPDRREGRGQQGRNNSGRPGGGGGR